jgi:hypothetical protein
MGCLFGEDDGRLSCKENHLHTQDRVFGRDRSGSGKCRVSLPDPQESNALKSKSQSARKPPDLSSNHASRKARRARAFWCVGSVRPDESGVIRGRTRRDSLKLTRHQASIFLVSVSALPALMATFVASSIGSLKGTSIRSRPCS